MIEPSVSAPRVLALFSGAGGLDLGFSLAGFNVRVSSDIEPTFLRSIGLNIGRYFPRDHHSICADVSTVTPEELGPGPYDFIIGGPPCQSFSAAGRRAGGVHGVNDFRGSLFWHYCRLIERFSPKGFLFENVRGLLQANHGRDWEVILGTFKDLGYRISFQVLDAADYGVPQHRERLIAVGTRSGGFQFPRPTHGPDSSLQQPYLSVGEALQDLDNPDEVVLPYGGKWGDLLAEIPPGMNYLFFTEEMGNPKPVFAWRSRFSDFLYKLDSALPSKTIVASQGRYGGPFHWKGRKLTLPEYKRLQSFPDDYEFFGSYLVAVKQIGNSVAPRFSKALAQAVMLQVFGHPYDHPIELLGDDARLSFDKRKRVKAAITRKNRSPIACLPAGQLALELCDKDKEERSFNFTWKYTAPRQRASLNIEIPSAHFVVKAKESQGEWNVSVRECSEITQAQLHLSLSFVPNDNRSFSSIRVDMECTSLIFAAVAWDAVNMCIEKSSSFTSVHPLYGHFTEPHPKFELVVDVESPSEPGLETFIALTSSFEYVSRVRSQTELASLFPQSQAQETIRFLRQLGWDVRSHETNRAIPEGFFRSCYPFTISLDEPRFVVWREIGTHKTADKSAIPTQGE